MAHTCPECDALCHCHGDVDDALLNNAGAIVLCGHDCDPGPLDDDDEPGEALS